MVDSLGGKVIQGTHFQPEMTHLVIDKPARNEKLLASIASGKWILHTSYIEDSYKAGKFLEVSVSLDVTSRCAAEEI